MPVRWGGVGIRKVSSVAPAAYLASISAAAHLMAALLPASCLDSIGSFRDEATTLWSDLAGTDLPSSQDAMPQRVLDDGICSAVSKNLLLRADPVNRARLMAALSPGSGSWLQALPSGNLGLRLGNNELRIAVGLRIGAPLVRHHLASAAAWSIPASIMASPAVEAPAVIAGTLKRTTLSYGHFARGRGSC